MNVTIPPDWPESLQELAAAAGTDAVNALLERWAGQRVYLRLQTLAPVVGELAAKKILRARGSGFWDCPKASSVYRRQRDAEILERHGKGETISALAGAFGLTPRAVRGILHAHRPTTKAAPVSTNAYFAHDNIDLDHQRYTRGDALPADMPPEALEPLLAAGVAGREPPPPDEPLPTAAELAAAPRGERQFCMVPTFIDWAALVGDYRIATGKPPMTREAMRELLEAWRKLPAHEQRSAFTQTELKLRDFSRAPNVALVN